MKKFFLFILPGFLAFAAHSQYTLPADKVPSVILMSFKQSYPKTERCRWELQRDSTYGVYFSMGSRYRHFARYDSTGRWLQHNENVDFAAIPAPVKQASESQFAGFEPMFVKSIDTVGMDLSYEIFLLQGNQFYIVRYSPGGAVLHNEGIKTIEFANRP